MMKRLMFLVLLLGSVYGYVYACDMSAMIVRNNHSFSSVFHTPDNQAFSNYNDPRDYFAFVMDRSNQNINNDGYGILYYSNGSNHLDTDNYWYKYLSNAYQANQVYYTGNYFNPDNQADIFDEAMGRILNDDANAAIVMCHARNSSSNPFAPGNHPFLMDVGGQTYSFMHNGGISPAARTFMINETNAISNHWFSSHSPNYPNFPNADSPAYWIDSEVIFNYLMCHIVSNNLNVLSGMQRALRKLEPYMKLSTNTVNFVFSDGQSLYAFRSTPLTGINCNYKLSYKLVGNVFYGIRTGQLTSGETEIKQYEMVVLSRDRKPENYPQFIKNEFFDLHLTDADLPCQAARRISVTPIHNTMDINISFYLKERAYVKVNVFNQKGQLIRRLTNGSLDAGLHKITWNGLDSAGILSARGVYFIETVNGSRRDVNKVLYMRN